MPMHIRDHRPRPGGMTDLTSPDVQRHPKDDDDSGDTRHGTICTDIATLLDPGVRVERQQEAKERWRKLPSISICLKWCVMVCLGNTLTFKAHNRQCDLTSNRSVSINHVHQNDVRALYDREIH